MKYKLLIDNRDKFKVEHDMNINLDYSNEIMVDGKKHEVDFVNFDEDDEIKSIFIDNTFYDVEVEKGEGGIPEAIVINGQRYPVSYLKVGRERFIVEGDNRQKSGVVKALIPGKVLNLQINIGDKVKEGELILILDAMKMENEIAAPKSGTVKQISVAEGENVEKGQLLLIIE